MTATTTDTTAAATGITEEQLVALQAGGWDDDGHGTPGWERAVETDDGGRADQLVFPCAFGGWDANANSYVGDVIRQVTFDEALAWCDKQAGGRKPAKAGSATKQEDRFPRWAEGLG